MQTSMQTWLDHVLFHAHMRPEAIAMAMEDRAITYGMLDAAITRCAHRIVTLDIPPGGLVAVRVQNQIRHLMLCLALFRLGIPSISIGAGQSSREAPPLAAVLCDGADGEGGTGQHRIAVIDTWFSEDAPGGALPPGFSSGAQLCRISLTSGSTGRPARVETTVRDLGRRMEKFGPCVDISRTGVLCMPGLSSSFGFTGAGATLATGRMVCFVQSPYQALRLIELFSIDAAIVSSEQLLALARVARKTRAQLSSLRRITVAGDAPSRTLLEAAAIHLCRDIVCLYGASEAGPIAHAHARDVLHDPGLAGYVLPGNEVGVFDATGAPCPAGTLGTLRFRSHETADDETAWIALGDIGWMADDGRLHVLGRATDVGAVNPWHMRTRRISPVHEVEHALRLEWDMTDAAAALIESAGAAAQIWIGVVGNGGASADALAAIVRPRGIEHAIRLVELTAIPRGVNGKVNRAQLQRLMLAGHIAASVTQSP